MNEGVDFHLLVAGVKAECVRIELSTTVEVMVECSLLVAVVFTIKNEAGY